MAMNEEVPKTRAERKREKLYKQLNERTDRHADSIKKIKEMTLDGKMSPGAARRISSEMEKNLKNPARFSEFHQDGRIDNGMSSLARNQTGVIGYAKRFVDAANPFSSVNRSNLANSMGLVTKDQMLGFKMNPSALGAVGMLAMPALSAYGLYETLSSGGDAMDYVSNYVAPTYLGAYGFRAGKAAGYLGTSLAEGMTGNKLKIPGMAKAGFGGLAGLTLGAAGIYAGLALGGLASAAVSPTSSLRSFVGASLARESTTQSFTSQESMTLRQKTLAKLSKSGLNDRGTILGNEASILRGMI